MPTIKKRINISVSNDIDRALMHLAKRDAVPAATKAAELIERALEIEEDEVWERIARARDTKDAKFVSHIKAWS